MTNPDTKTNYSPQYSSELLGGSWDLVTTYNWAYNPTYNPAGLIGVTPIIGRVISPVISSYSVA